MKKDFFLLYDPSKSNLSISLIGQYFLISARFISEKGVLVVSLNPPHLMGLFVNSMLRSWGLPWERERERESRPTQLDDWSEAPPGPAIQSNHHGLFTPRCLHRDLTQIKNTRLGHPSPWSDEITSKRLKYLKKKLILSESSQKLKKNSVECKT